MKQKVNDIEFSCKAISSLFDSFKDKVSRSEHEVNELEKVNSRLLTEIADLNKKYSQVSEDLLDIKTRSMQENLFFSIAEAPAGIRDDTEVKLKRFS